MKAASGSGKGDNKVKPAAGRDQFVGGRRKEEKIPVCGTGRRKEEKIQVYRRIKAWPLSAISSVIPDYAKNPIVVFRVLIHSLGAPLTNTFTTVSLVAETHVVVFVYLGGLAMDLEMGHDHDCGNKRTLSTSFAFAKLCEEMSLNFYRIKEIDLKDFYLK